MIGHRLVRAALALLLYAFVAPSATLAQAVVSVVPLDSSFGTLRSANGADPELEVRIVNRAEAATPIDRVVIGCGCMSLDWVKPVVLAPGAEALIHVSLDLSKMHVGAAKYPLSVFSDDRAVATAAVRYVFDPTIESIPRDLWLQPPTPGAAPEGVARLRVRDAQLKEKIAEIRAETDDRSLEVELASVDDDESVLMLRVRAMSSHPFGPSESAVRLFLAAEADPILTMPVHAVHEPPVTPTPATVLLQELSVGVPVEREITLGGTVPFRVAGVRTSCPAVQAEQARAGEPVYLVRVLPIETSGDYLDESVTFTFDQPAEFSISVPVVGAVVSGIDSGKGKP